MFEITVRAVQQLVVEEPLLFVRTAAVEQTMAVPHGPLQGQLAVHRRPDPFGRRR